MWTKENIPDQHGKSILVTGANSGIGYETAVALHEAGAHVILACRDVEKGEEAATSIKRKGGSGSLNVLTLDLSDFDRVKVFADQVIRSYGRLDVLINNAGVANVPASKTMQGYELQFGVNFLGHFVLTGLLYPLLSSNSNARIITVSSNGYQTASIDFENLKSEKSYHALREYRQSKLSNLIFALELDRRIKAKGDTVLSIAAQPGANNTNLMRHVSKTDLKAGRKRLGEFMEPWQGALSILYAAVSNEAIAGEMYEPEDNGLRGYPTLASLRENVLNKKTGEDLWHFAEIATGVKFL